MIECVCINKFRKTNGEIYGYRLQAKDGTTHDFTRNELLHAIRNKSINVINLQIASDGRIVYKKINEEYNKETELLTIFKKMLSDISHIINEKVNIRTIQASNKLIKLLRESNEYYSCNIKTYISDLDIYIIKTNKSIKIVGIDNKAETYKMYGNVILGSIITYKSIDELKNNYNKDKELIWQILGIIDSNAVNKFVGNTQFNLSPLFSYVAGSQDLNNILNRETELYNSNYDAIIQLNTIKSIDKIISNVHYNGEEYVFRTILNKRQISSIRNNKTVIDKGFKSTSLSLMMCLNWGATYNSTEDREIIMFKIKNKNCIYTRSLYTKDQLEITVDRKYSFKPIKSINITMIRDGSEYEYINQKLTIVELVSNKENTDISKIKITNINDNNYLDALYDKINKILLSHNISLDNPIRYASYCNESKNIRRILLRDTGNYALEKQNDTIIFSIKKLDNNYKEKLEKVNTFKIEYNTDNIHENANIISQYIINEYKLPFKSLVRMYDFYMKQCIVEYGFDILVDKGFAAGKKSKYNTEIWDFTEYKYIYYVNGNKRNSLALYISIEQIPDDKNHIIIKYGCKTDGIKVKEKIDITYNNITELNSKLEKSAYIIIDSIMKRSGISPYKKFEQMINYIHNDKIHKISNTQYTYMNKTIIVNKDTDWKYIVQSDNIKSEISGYKTIHNMSKEFKTFLKKLDN